jgi:ssDNA-binding Zn-finger/Zn-ribbon topoisomerase 1
MTMKNRCPKCGEDRQIECIPTKKTDKGGESYFCNVCAHQWSADAHELR